MYINKRKTLNSTYMYFNKSRNSKIKILVFKKLTKREINYNHRQWY